MHKIFMETTAKRLDWPKNAWDIRGGKGEGGGDTNIDPAGRLNKNAEM